MASASSGRARRGAVGRGAADKIRSATVVIAPVPGAEPGAADAVGGGDTGQDGESGGDVEVLVAVAFIKDKGCDLKVGTGGPQPTLGLGCPAVCSAR